MRNADKWLAQGNYKAALEEYQKIIEKDPKDSTTLNMMGDIYLRISNVEKAISCFTQAAENLEKQGFIRRAIAVYQKILKNKPDSIEFTLKLAHLYEESRSYAEARQYYSKAAEEYRKQGKKGKSLEVWKKIAEIDPNSAEVYLQIAEICLQEGQTQEAVKALIEAGSRFVAREKLEQALEAFRRAYELNPDDFLALSGLVKIQMKLGYADEAASILEKALNKQRYNREFWSLLLDCYIELENPSEAERAVINLTEQEPANYPRFLDVVKLYLKTSDLVGASRILSMASEHLLISGQSSELLRWIDEILAKDPEQIDALKLLVRYHSYLNDEKEKKNALERLAEAARLNNEREEEIQALRQLLEISPYETQYQQRLQELVPEDIHLVSTQDSHLSTETFSDLSTETFVEEKSFDFVKSEDNPPQVQDFIEKFESVFYKEHETRGDLENIEQIYESNVEIVENTGNGSGEVISETLIEQQRKERLQEAINAKLQEELESVRRFRDLGGYDLALKALASLEQEFGSLEEIVNLRNEIEQEALRAVSENERTKSEQVQEDKQVPKQRTQKKFTKKVDTSELFEDIIEELGFEQEESTATGDFDTHYQLGIAYKEMGLLEDAISEFQEAVKLTSPDDGTKRYFYCCNMLGICFMEKQLPSIALMWYQRAMETIGLEEEELQGLRYEIANAYEMSGEKDRALEYFEQIYAIDVNYRDVGQRLAQLQAFRHNQEEKYSF